MSFRIEKETGDIVISGFEQGIAASPHKGIGNMQCVNISTEAGEAMCNYARTAAIARATYSGTGSYVSGGKLLLNNPTPVVQAGSWITVSGTTSSMNLPNGNYFVLANDGANTLTIAQQYNAVQFVIGGTAGATVVTANTALGKPVADTTETYLDASGNTQYRYYVVDANAIVWVYDTALTYGWTVIDVTTLTSIDSTDGETVQGLAVYKGILHLFLTSTIWLKRTANLGANIDGQSLSTVGWTRLTITPATGINNILNATFASKAPHYTFIGTADTLYYTDGHYVGSILSSSNSQSSTTPNVWSSGTYTVNSSTGLITVTQYYGGDIPQVGQTITFDATVTNPTGFTATTVFYVKSVASATTFKVAASVGGSAVTPSDTGTGTQFFNSYHPDVTETVVWAPQALELPTEETATSITELGLIVLVGCQSENIFTWGQVNPSADGHVALPEKNCVSLIAVNNMAYAFAGNKGNIYVTNGVTSSPVTTVPDYTAASPTGTAIEPYFVWGGAMYIRGRVFFSVQAANCGGIWSFIPTQNIFIGQDTGIALRMDYQSSYGTYAGLSPLLIPAVNQASLYGPQFWNVWADGVGNYGIDTGSTTPYTGGQSLIETDIVPTGQLLGTQKKTFSSIEYKLSTALATNESVAINYRQNITSAWVSCGTVNTDSSGLSGVYQALAFQASQWLQLQAVLTSTSSNPSFVRLTEIRIHP